MDNDVVFVAPHGEYAILRNGLRVEIPGVEHFEDFDELRAAGKIERREGSFCGHAFTYWARAE